MRLYSLRESPIFQNVEKDGPNKDKQNKKKKIQAIFRKQRVIQVVADFSKQYYLRISDKQKIRQILIKVDCFQIEKMLIFSDHLILLLSDKLIRYIRIDELFEQYLYYDTKRIIFNEKVFKAQEKWLKSHIQDICFNRMGNCLYVLEIVNKTITISKFNQNLLLEKMENFELNQCETFEKIRFIPNSYQEGGYDDAHFGIQISFNLKPSSFYFLQITFEFQIRFYKIYDLQDNLCALNIRRINQDSYVLYYKNRLAFLKRENNSHKWFFQYQIFSQGQIISQLKYGNMILTLEKSSQLYCLFQYDLNKMIKMLQTSPYLIQIYHKPMNLSHIENDAGINIAFVGSRPFLVEGCIFNIFSALRDVRSGNKQYCYQNLSKIGKQEIFAYQIINQNPRQQRKCNFINELSQYYLIQQRINHLLTILKQLSSKQYRSILFYFSYEYFTIFLYIYHFLMKQQTPYPSDKPYLPSNLNFLIGSVIEKCQQFYDLFVKNQKFPKLRNLCKKAYSIGIFCRQQLEQASNIFQNMSTFFHNSGSSIIAILYNPTLCLEFTLFELRNSFLNQDSNYYRKIKYLLSKLLQLSDDYPPLIYLIIDRPQNYVVNAHHLLQIQLRRQQQAQHDESIIDFLKGQSIAVQNYKRYNYLQCIELFSSYKECRNVLFIRDFTFRSHNRKGQQLRQSNTILTKSCKTLDKLLESRIRLDGLPNEQTLEISQQQIIKMKAEMSQTIPLQLFSQQMSNYYHFCSYLQLESRRIKRSILLFIEDINFVRRYNYKRKYDIKYINNERYKFRFEGNRINLRKKQIRKDRMLIEFQNLFDPLLLGYIMRIANICDKFHLASLSPFSSKYLDVGETNKFGQFLKNNSFQTSEIIKCQNNYEEVDIIIPKIANQLLFIHQLQNTIMSIYLFIAQIQQNKFQISEHIRSTYFAQELININRLRKSYQNKTLFKLQAQNLQLEQLINVKKLNKDIKQIENNLKYFLQSSPKQSLIPQAHKELINLCLILKISWIGDSIDLFMQIASQPSQIIYKQGFLDNLCLLLCSNISAKT